MFKLDSRLQNDTFFVCDLPLCRVLLMNDSQFVWVILVPRVEGVTDIIDLTTAQQQQLMIESAQVSRALKSQFNPDKLNVAALGNVVSQLHIHHIARYINDVAWPKPVWGAQPTIAYSAKSAASVVEKLKQALK